MSLRKLHSNSLADKARDMIRTAILEGHIRPEERITIEGIAAQLGISRTPVREALKALESDGIIKLLPYRGAVVQRLQRAELDDRYSVRAAIEALAAERACLRQGRDLGEILAANQRKLTDRIGNATPDDLDAASDLAAINADFHNAILQASGSTTSIRMLDTLRMPMAYRLYHWRSPARQRIQAEFHGRIVEAFLQEDPAEVRRRMEQHVLEGRDFLLGTL